ncbi:hypothetical protein [Pricia sp.]|uniref:hypothetical protein n=1 Tax=Pricia sp. TaxID=2268138 RepID=UPI0035930308
MHIEFYFSVSGAIDTLIKDVSYLGPSNISGLPSENGTMAGRDIGWGLTSVQTVLLAKAVL